MQDIRAIAENIVAIRARRSELVASGTVEAALAAELSDLEARDSLFTDICIGHHRVNLCQAGFVYGEVLRHPVDPQAGIVVRLADRVEIVDGPDACAGEMTILEATVLIGRRAGVGAAFRDWHAGGRSLGRREDDLLMGSPRGEALKRSLLRIGTDAVEREDRAPVTDPAPSEPPSMAKAKARPTTSASTPATDARAPKRPTSTSTRKARTDADERMPDLFG